MSRQHAPSPDYSEHWLRDRATPIIARVLEQTRGQSETKVRRALADAYPFGPYLNPKKVWRDEIERQRGPKVKPPKVDPRQLKLFES